MINDVVMLLSPANRKKKIQDKKTARYLGPFEVVAIHLHNSYTIESESGQKHLIPASRLRKFIPRYSNDEQSLVGGEWKYKKSECNVIDTSLD